MLSRSVVPSERYAHLMLDPVRAVADQTSRRLASAIAPYQLMRIAEALLGITNELKQYALSGRSTVPRFADTLHWLYPDTKDDPGIALDLVQHPVKLHNALAYAIEDARKQVEAAREAAQVVRQAERRGWWQVFGSRKR